MISFSPKRETIMNNIEKRLQDESLKIKDFEAFIGKFAQIEDPRVNRRKLHPLESILAIYLCAAVCNRTSWEEVFDFASNREDFFKNFVPLPHGIPSADTFARVIERINPKLIQEITLEWVNSIHSIEVEEKQIILDGKTLRGTKNGNKAQHLVNAWICEENFLVAQELVTDKSNEISAMKKIIENLDISGSIVSIDAMGCQTEIARKIIEGKGDFLFTVKANQHDLHKKMQQYFSAASIEKYEDLMSRYVTTEKDHGRIEKREYIVMQAPLSLRRKWRGLKTLGTVISHRTISAKTSTEQRYFITSTTCDAAKFGQIVRNHWSIENSLHWVLDVNFREDQSRIRSGFSAQNASWFRGLALSLLKKEPTRLSIRRKMLKAADSLTYLHKVLSNPLC